MYCVHCGQEVRNEAIICPHCGCEIGTAKNSKIRTDDAKSTGWAVLGFFFPLVGLILYLVWKDEYPLRSKSIGKGALISVIVEIALAVLVVILYIFIFLFVFLGLSGTYY